MQPEPTLADVLRERGVRRDALVQATRYYLAERLQDPPAEQLLADLGDQAPIGAELSAEVARNPALLPEVALGVLSAAWERPGERSRIERALDDAGGKLSSAELVPVAITLVYGLFLAVRTGRSFTTTTSMTPDGGYETKTVELQGALAIMVDALRTPPPPPIAPAAGAGVLPGEGTFTLLLLDIQRSSQIPGAERSPLVTALLSIVHGSLKDVGVVPAQIFTDDAGDGCQVLVPEPAGALTPLVARLPALIGKRLAELRGRPVQVRMGIHTGRLRHDERGWRGTAWDHLERITNAEAIKTRLARSDQRLATVLSDRVHRETVHEGYVDAPYERVQVTRKETTAWVWLMLS